MAGLDIAANDRAVPPRRSCISSDAFRPHELLHHLLPTLAGGMHQHGRAVQINLLALPAYYFRRDCRIDVAALIEPFADRLEITITSCAPHVIWQRRNVIGRIGGGRGIGLDCLAFRFLRLARFLRRSHYVLSKLADALGERECRIAYFVAQIGARARKQQQSNDGGLVWTLAIILCYPACRVALCSSSSLVMLSLPPGKHTTW